ncbi:MAG: hypothetical protein QOK15_73, partial [Nocardioidaceae bacterium]|nr:hypothetical protein [Nocardioidaceae bacterium]
ILGLMPDAYYRLLAYPTAIALMGLGVSLWRTTNTAAAVPPADVTIPSARTSPDAEAATQAPTIGSAPK